MNQNLTGARITIAQLNGNEARVISTNAMMKDLWTRRQALMLEMNEAKKRAAEEAARPYQEQIEDIDTQYALLLHLVSDNGDDST